MITEVSHPIACFPVLKCCVCIVEVDGWMLRRLGWGLLSQFSPFRYFPNVSSLWEHALAIEFHVYIWQVSPKFSCGDTCQIWMWFKEFKKYFCKIEYFAYGEINERSFNNPHPCWAAGLRCSIISEYKSKFCCFCSSCMKLADLLIMFCLCTYVLCTFISLHDLLIMCCFCTYIFVWLIVYWTDLSVLLLLFGYRTCVMLRPPLCFFKIKTFKPTNIEPPPPPPASIHQTISHCTLLGEECSNSVCIVKTDWLLWHGFKRKTVCLATMMVIILINSKM